MKIRFTLGNIVALAGTVVGYVADHSTAIASLTPYGGKIVAAASILALFTKGLVTGNADKIPDAAKHEAAGVIFEKSGFIKP